TGTPSASTTPERPATWSMCAWVLTTALTRTFMARTVARMRGASSPASKITASPVRSHATMWQLLWNGPTVSDSMRIMRRRIAWSSEWWYLTARARTASQQLPVVRQPRPHLSHLPAPVLVQPLRILGRVGVGGGRAHARDLRPEAAPVAPHVGGRHRAHVHQALAREHVAAHSAASTG